MDVDLLRSTWRDVSRFGKDVPAHFYARLFLAHPDVRPLFGADMTEQRAKLAAMLGAVVRSADNLDAVVPILQRLGRDHRRFGAVEAHYTAVGQALLATLEHFLGEGWTDDVANTWTEAYTTVAGIMIGAANEADQHRQPSCWDCAILQVAFPQRDVVYLVFDAPAIELPTDGVVVPVALHGTPGDWLPIRPFPTADAWAAYVDISDDPRTLALARAQPGDLLRIGTPLPVDQEDTP